MNATKAGSSETQITMNLCENAQKPPWSRALISKPFRPRVGQGLSLSDAQANSYGILLFAAACLGVLSYVALLASQNIADWDLWAKLALGAHVWHYGTLPHHDLFAFTPVLPEYVDHECGAGAIFFGLLRFFGPTSLMLLKIVLACGTLLLALWTGRQRGGSWTALLLLAIPAAGCVLFGYVPVVRSHAFTFFFFALVLFCLERLGNPSPPFRPAGVILGTMLVWVNVHGGFVAGLGAIAVYSLVFFWLKYRDNLLTGVRPLGVRISGTSETAAAESARTPNLLFAIAVASLAVTCINPYGPKFWFHLLPAILAKRPLIHEWQPLPFFAADLFLVFRVLFLVVICSLVFGWKGVEKKSWAGLIMLGITAVLAWRSRRHVPFFGVTSLAFAGPYLTATWARLRALAGNHYKAPRLETPGYLGGWSPFLISALYLGIALYAANCWLPQASLQVLAPIGDVPVREADILARAQAKGNLAVPFSWGSYAAWRLYPGIKISIDGRYEAAFPESTFQLNIDFFAKRGVAWDRLIRDYAVDYVILDLSHGGLRPQDLSAYGYVKIWETPGLSALMALQKHAPQLLATAKALPPTTINPLDARITDKWF